MRFSVMFIVCLSVLATSTLVSSNILMDLGKSGKDVVIGVAQKVPDVIPSPSEIFSASKNVIAGYPFEVAFTVINEFCAATLSKNRVRPREKFLPELSKMNYILFDKENEYLVPLQQPHDLWSHRSFDPSMKTTIFVTGWTSNINRTNDALDTVSKAYKCRGDVNFIAIDTAQYVDTLYTWAAFNTEEIGRLLAVALKDLIETTSYPVENIHLIGHSLGAHIVGSAGRHFTLMTEQLLPRITGLDAANPCFNEGENLTGLSRGDAMFVDAIHTNNGALGKREPLGDADFYPNGIVSLPPGCLTIVCGHARAWEYYAETVYPGNEDSLLAVRCNSLTKLNSGNCPGQKHIMGYGVSHSLKGNYFLSTAARSPYGIGRQGKNIMCHRSNYY